MQVNLKLLPYIIIYNFILRMSKIKIFQDKWNFISIQEQQLVFSVHSNVINVIIFN